MGQGSRINVNKPLENERHVSCVIGLVASLAPNIERGTFVVRLMKGRKADQCSMNPIFQ